MGVYGELLVTQERESEKVHSTLISIQNFSIGHGFIFLFLLQTTFFIVVCKRKVRDVN